MTAYRRITDRLLDLDGRNPRPYHRPAVRPAPKEISIMQPLTKRPARPKIIPDELMARAVEATGSKAREITDVVDDPRGLIVTTISGTRTIVVPEDRPDGLGQTGLLYYPTPGRKPGRNVRVYVEHDQADPDLDRGEPWTLAELIYAAGREILPALIGGPGGPSRLPWVGTDPVRAYAVWAHIAKPHSGNLRAAVRYSPEAARCRGIVIGSQLLAADEAAKL